jgi:ATP-dependent DNA ligase
MSMGRYDINIVLPPEIAADLQKLPDIAIDGELVMLDDKGSQSFTNSEADARYAIQEE